jgi:hypothetical protein
MSGTNKQYQTDKNDKSNFGTILSTTIYAVTVLMVLTYLYQSFTVNVLMGAR